MGKPLIVILGPTCVGKTETSIFLAEKLDGEIISADSRTFYKAMDIGTAKPSKEEQLRIQHHLVDVADPNQTWNLAIFQQAARQVIQQIHLRGHIPFLVGGTGQYIRSVIYNWSLPAIFPDPRMRIILENFALAEGNESLHHALHILDPEAASLIDARNVRRTIRALEVIFTSGRQFSSLRSSNTSPYHLITIGLLRPRVELYERIDRRIDQMFANGFIKEVKSLIEAGYSPDLPSFSAIGYRECANVIAGHISKEQAITEIKRKTRIFVRRQANWFKVSDPGIHWFDLSESSFSDIEEFLIIALNSNINPDFLRSYDS
jgi:tRNA dimethylallyltransferase